ncbi:nicotinate-nucleotide adenylyltransferase [Sediminibacterium roseum]|uniref:Probable nicotinate-nucleotide adenylyltransferase n=1 Tax=Sediminibacterium roseum TaxID=1978412 RepID=A0ABW9ZP91_9BACT|nr:nicotinate (nicotinamide) nucleotide adenylyltransferase [Sediminibacterium roseum]NCI48307.1 nicotinate-nucleotide adenylyltransferase [Sediminibacterium roseum]
MKIGLYFGSFNPIHIGHLIIASHVVDHTDMQQVWFVVSPQNPMKPSSVLLNEYHRLHLVHLAIEDDLRLKASEVEFKLPRPSYTIDTLTYLQEKYPQHDFSVIMGSDSFQNLPRWKNFELLIKNYAFIIYNRPGFEVKDPLNARLTILDAPMLELSATEIRETIREGKSIRYLVPDKVREEIEKYGYYK